MVLMLITLKFRAHIHVDEDGLISIDMKHCHHFLCRAYLIVLAGNSCLFTHVKQCQWLFKWFSQQIWSFCSIRIWRVICQRMSLDFVQFSGSRIPRSGCLNKDLRTNHLDNLHNLLDSPGQLNHLALHGEQEQLEPPDWRWVRLSEEQPWINGNWTSSFSWLIHWLHGEKCLIGWLSMAFGLATL